MGEGEAIGLRAALAEMGREVATMLPATGAALRRLLRDDLRERG